MSRMPQKNFCIGFRRTGTRSLTTYSERLGFDRNRWPGKVDGACCEHRIVRSPDGMERIVEFPEPVIVSYDAFNDVPFPALDTELGRRHPESRFILVPPDRASRNGGRNASRGLAGDQG